MASPFLYCPTPPAHLTSSQKGLALFHTPAFASAHPSACNPYSFAFLSPVHAFIHLISKPSLTICSGPGAVLGILCCHFSVPTSVVSEPGEGDRLALIVNCHDKALSRVYRMPSWKPFPMLLPLESLHEPLPCFCQSLLHSLRTAPSLVCCPFHSALLRAGLMSVSHLCILKGRCRP